MSQDPAQLDNRVFKLLMDPQSLNFYAYSRNNPVNLVDTSGELSWVTAAILPFVPSLSAAYSAGNLLAASLSSSNPITSSFLSHSLELNPGNIMITESNQGDWGNVIDTIKGTEIFQSSIEGMISSAEASGATVINSSDNLNLHETSDLQMAMGHSNMQVNGSQGKDGSWDLEVNIYDQYHFDHGFEYNSGVGYEAMNQGAATAQDTGLISPFYEDINFDYHAE